MFLKSILINSYQLFSLSMGILDLLDASELSMAAGVFISIAVAVHVLISKLWKKNSVLTQPSGTDVESLNFQRHLLKHVSCKIAEERSHMERSMFRNLSLFQECILKGLKFVEPSLDGTLSPSLEQKYSVQNRQAEEILKILEALKNDFFALRNNLKHASPVLEKLVRIQFQNLSSDVAAFPTQTEEIDEDAQGLYEEVSGSELLISILEVTKESFENLALENHTRGNEMIQSISRFLEQSQKDFQKEITLFSSVVAGSEDDHGSDSSPSLIAEVEKIERNLLETFIFLNRQRFDMENMKKTLAYFTKKFVYVALKFDAYWQQSKASYTSASQRLKEIEVLWNSVTDKMDTSSGQLQQQSKILSSKIAEMHDVLATRERNFVSPFTLNMIGSDTSEKQDEMDVARIQNIDQKLHDLLDLSENSINRLNSLERMSKHLENFHDIVSSMSEGYATLTSFLSSSMQNSEKFDSCQSLCPDKSEENSRNFGSKRDNKSSKKISEKGNDCTIDDGLWDEVRHELHELNSEFQIGDIDDIITILKDVVKTKWDIVDDGEARSEDGSVAASIEGSACSEAYLQANEHWQDFSPESSLDGITNDCLVLGSESDED